MVGVDAGDGAAGFYFYWAVRGGGAVAVGGGDAFRGVGEGEVDADGSAGGVEEELVAGEVAGVDGEGLEVEGLCEGSGKGGAGEGGVGFEEVGGEGVGEGDGFGAGGVGEGLAVVVDDSGGAGVFGEGAGEVSGPEEGLDDGAVSADEFEVAGGEGIEIDGGAEFDGAGEEFFQELLEDVGAGDEVGVGGAAFSFGAAGGVDVEESRGILDF